MFKLVNVFFLQRPLFDVFDVPMFYQLFQSDSDKHVSERIWLLRYITNGVRTKEDLRILGRRYVILAFSSTRLPFLSQRRIGGCAYFFSAWRNCPVYAAFARS